MTPRTRTGVMYAVASFVFWGLNPIYFKAVAHVHALDVLGHRILWSVPLTALIITAGRQWAALREAVRSPRVVATLTLSALLVSGNWLTFIYGVTTDRILHTSLGYYINPLVNVVLGMIFLRERLTRPQVLAVLLAAAGTLNLTFRLGELPWIALVLAFSFGFYGLIRKTVRIESVPGLFVETTLLLPFAALYLGWLAARGDGAFASAGWTADLLLVAAGVVTVLPLVWFTSAARRLTYAAVGLFQYIAPSLTFILAVFFYGEPFTPAHALTFGLIWTGLGIFAADTVIRARRLRGPGG